MSDKNATIFAGVVSNIQQNVISEKNVGLRILQEQVSNLTANLAAAQDEINRKSRELEEALDDVEYYKSLLGKPIQEIAAKHGAFRESYEKQMELMASWMVSQKAFKELAIVFGNGLGLDVEDIKEMGKNKENDVLENKHNPENKTNASDAPILQSRSEKMLALRKARAVD